MSVAPNFCPSKGCDLRSFLGNDFCHKCGFALNKTESKSSTEQRYPAHVIALGKNYQNLPTLKKEFAYVHYDTKHGNLFVKANDNRYYAVEENGRILPFPLGNGNGKNFLPASFIFSCDIV